MSPDSEAAPARENEGRTTRTSHEEDAPTTVATPDRPPAEPAADTPAPAGRDDDTAPTPHEGERRDRGGEAPRTLDTPPDTTGVMLTLPAGYDAPAAALILDTIADTLAPGSKTTRLLRGLAAELGDVERIHALRARVEQARAEREQERLRERLAVAWAEVVEEHNRQAGYQLNPNRFRREWEKYPDPNTGRPYPLRNPRTFVHWQAQVDGLDAAGVPWRVVRDVIHDVLTGPEEHRTLTTVIRRCHRHRRRQQERALRLVRDGDPQQGLNR